MLKFKKLFRLICFISIMALSSSIFVGCNNDGSSSGDGGTTEIAKVTGLTYDATVTDSQAISTVSAITYTVNETSYDVTLDASTDNAIMAINGVQYDLISSYVNGTEYTVNSADDVVINVTTKGDAEAGTGVQKFYSGNPSSITYYTNTAAWITSEGFQSAYSASSALVDGTTDSTSSTGVTIDSKGGFFSGYYIDGADYNISDLKMTLNGNGGDDFQGWGAGILATNGADVSIDNAIIDTTGVIRTAIWAGGTDTKLTVTNSVISGYNRDDATTFSDEDNYAVPMMEQVPFALGLIGNIRATNVLGSASAIFTNSIVVCNAWGVLSTDSGIAGTKALDVSNVLSGVGEVEVYDSSKTYTATKTVNGVKYGFTIATLGERSGYVTYADSGVYDVFTNVEFYAPDYIAIIASQASNLTMTNSYGYSDRIGFLIHQNQATVNAGNGKKGGLYIEGGEYKVADTFVLVKGGNINNSYTKANIEVSDATINIFGTNAQSSALLRLMNSDDAGNPGNTSYTIDDLTTETEYLGATTDTTVDAVTATFTGMTVKGDIYNTVYDVDQALDVTLSNMDLTGTISSAWERHVDAEGNAVADNTTIYADATGDYLYIGRTTSTPEPAVNNDIYLTLEDGTTWTVTNTSYLSKLSICNGCTIVGSITVGGVSVTPGTTAAYEGTIVVSPN